MPRFIGILLLLGGVAYIIKVAFAVLILAYRTKVNMGTIIFYFPAKFFTILWLLIIGISVPKQVQT